MAATETGAPVAGRLAELRRAVGRAERRVAELEGRARGAQRTIDRAVGPLTEYFEEVGAGRREPDADEEARLRGAVSAAQTSVVLRPSMAHGRIIGVEAFDVEVEALLAGARRAVEDARQAVAAFAGERFEELCAERLPRSRQVGEDGRRLLSALLRWRELHVGEVRWWQDVCKLAGIPPQLVRSPVELPDPELAGRLGRPGDVRGVFPIPKFLLEEDDGDGGGDVG